MVRGMLTVVILSAAASAQVGAAELKQQTKDAFARFRAATEERINAELAEASKNGKPLLHFERLPDDQRQKVLERLQRGEVVVERVASGESVHITGGLIHDWMATSFIPGATLGDVLRLAQDYDHHQQFFAPEVERSRLISHTGPTGKNDDFHIFYRLRRHKVITVVLDTEHEVRYTHVDAMHAYSTSHTSKISEVDDAGGANERELPPEQGHGFLWELDSYWRFEQADGGVYVQCEAISLTRDVPTGLGWLVGPFVQSIPKDSLTSTLVNERKAVLGQNKSTSVH